MTLSICLKSFLLLSAIVSCSFNSFSSVDALSPFTSSDSERILEVLKSDNNNEKDLSKLSHSIQVYNLIGSKHPQSDSIKSLLETELKTKLKSIKNDNSNELIKLNEILQGLLSLGIKPEFDEKTLQTALDSSSRIDEIYLVSKMIQVYKDSIQNVKFSVDNSIDILLSCLDDDGSFRSSISSDEDGSAYNAGLALSSLSILLPFASLEYSNIAKASISTKLLKSLIETGKLSDSSTSSLTTVDYTSSDDLLHSNSESIYSMLIGINEYQKNIMLSTSNNIELNQKYLLSITNTIIQSKYTTSYKNIISLIKSIELLNSNDKIISYPQLTLQILKSDKKSIIFQIYDLKGKIITNDIRVSISSFQSLNDNKLLEGSFRSELQLKENLFILEDEKLTKLPLGDLIAIINVEVSNNSKLYKPIIDLPIKISRTTFVKKLSVSSAITDSLKAEIDAQSVVHPQKLTSLLKADNKQFLIVSISIEFEDIIQPSQVMLQLENQVDSNSSGLFVASSKSDGSYQIKLALGSSELIELIKGLSGIYNLNILIGDIKLENSINYNFGNLELSLPSSAKISFDESSNESKQSLLPEIKHTFRSAETRPIFILPVIFTILVTIPFIGLIGILFFSPYGVKIEFPSDATEFASATLFHSSLAAFVGLFVLYWIKLNIFQAFTGAAALGLITLLSGNRALRAVHLRNQLPINTKSTIKNA